MFLEMGGEFVERALDLGTVVDAATFDASRCLGTAAAE
jgi:hypothetical protein